MKNRLAFPEHPRRQSCAASDRIAGLLAASLAVLVIAIGLRLIVDALPLASRFSAGGTEVGPAPLRSAGVALLAMGQWIAAGGVVRRFYRHGRLDGFLVASGMTVTVFATFAAVLLALAGRS